MSDPYSTDQAEGMPTSLGPPSGFFENVEAAQQQQYVHDSFYSLDAEVRNQWIDSLQKLRAKTGKVYDVPSDWSSIDAYIRQMEGTSDGVHLPTIATLANKKKFDEANAEIKALNDPNIASFEQIISNVKDFRKQVEQRYALDNANSTIMGKVGSFLGSLAGSISPRDPLLTASLMFGGVGRTAAMRIATEAGIFGGVTAAQEYGSVEPTREMLGEPAGSPAISVMYSMLGAGLLRGGAEALARFVGGRTPITELPEGELKLTLKAREDSSAARAADHLLAAQDSFDAANPYGDTTAGKLRFSGELAQVHSALSTGEKGNLLAGTAAIAYAPDTSISLQARTLDELAVSSQYPDVFARFDEARTKLQQATDAVQGSESDINQLTLADAVRRIDPASGDLIDSYMDDLEKPGLTNEKKAEINDKIDKIVQSLGEENVIKAAHEAAIEPKKTLKGWRASRRAALRNYNKAAKEFDNALQHVKTNEAAKEAAAQRAAIAKTAIGLRATDAAKPVSLKAADIEAAVTATDEASKEIDNISQKIVDDLEEQESDILKLDDGTEIPADFSFSIEMPDGTSTPISAKEVLEDLKADEALIEAMRTCAV